MTSEIDIAEVRRWLPAAPEKVFTAFSDAALVRRWLSPAPEISFSVLELDFRVGGRYRFAYDVPGSGTMRVNGRYRAIERPSKLVFTWNIEPPDVHAGTLSEVTVTLAREDGGTLLVIRHARLTMADAARRHAEGWRGALDLLTLLLGVSPAPERTE